VKFVILPDNSATGTTAAQLERLGARALRHASGNPWIVGWWSHEDLVVAAVGDRRVAVLGRTTADRQTLERGLRGVRTNADLTRLAGELSGCFHLISSLAGQVRAQGSLIGVCRIYYAMVNGVTVAADRADWLVRWTGASLDEDLLPLRLLLPYGPPWPLSHRCMWRGVREVTPGHWLQLDRDGGSRIRRWWSAPEPELSQADGAQRVRAALEESIRARAGSSGTSPLSLDLSGGMDSTSLCYLAHHLNIPTSTVHYAFSDPANPDSLWAERARRNLGPGPHAVVPTSSMPGFFTEEASSLSALDLDGPADLVYPSKIEHVAGLAASAGAGRHLRGHGADTLFMPDLTLANELLKWHPWRRLQILLAKRARARLSLAAVLKQMRGPGSYRSWLLRSARSLSPGRKLEQDGGWEIAPQPPEWATPEAVAQARQLYLEAANADPEPLGPSPALHLVLRCLHTGAQHIRQSSAIGEPFGVVFDGPYLDDRVVEAVLSIRPRERFQAKVNKPVLAAAMRGVMPQEALERTDKSNGDRELFDGVRRSRRRLEEVLADPLLAQRGLVDARAMRAVVLGLQTDVNRLAQLGQTWACEIWLRAQEAAGHRSIEPPVRQPLAAVR
jgi:asparagine synthase (glutamine-hydrolysing)